MLVLEAEAIQFEGRRAAILKTRDHRLAAARIAAHRVDGDGIVRRQQAGIDQRPQQRNAAGRIAAGIGDFSGGPDLVGLVRREFGKAVSPVGGDPKRRRRVEHLGSRSAHAVDQGNGFLRGIVRQAEDDEIDLLHQRPLGARILALLLGDVFHHDVVLQPKPLRNAEPRRSGAAVNEHGGLGRGADGLVDGLGLMAVGEGHGTVLSSWFVSLAKACKGRACFIKCAICCAPASACAASDPAIAA